MERPRPPEFSTSPKFLILSQKKQLKQNFLYFPEKNNPSSLFGKTDNLTNQISYTLSKNVIFRSV